jgi:thiamine-monophosphate kinase
MQLSQVGELKLLREVREKFSATNADILIGIGDDASVIAPQEEKLLITTDMMNEGIHFDLGYSSPFHIGFKLTSVNVSDIMAMGGSPRFLFLNISMKKDTDEEVFWKLYEGIAYAMDIYGVKLLGGDLCSAKNDMAISATVIGTAGKIITRGSARIGDKIYVTGNIGDSACGLEILKRLTQESKKKVQKSEVRSQKSEEKTIEDITIIHNSELLTLKWHMVEPLIRRHLMPVARDSSEIAKYASSMIDVSDGLFIDICRICDESNVGARVYLDKIPISDEMKKVAEIMELDPIHLATSGGEDYELLFTAPPEIKFEIRNSKFEILKTTCIGEIIEKERVVVDKTGRELLMKAEGYQHFGI